VGNLKIFLYRFLFTEDDLWQVRSSSSSQLRFKQMKNEEQKLRKDI